MRRTKKCGNCFYFTKFKCLEGDSGLCEYYDCRTKDGGGKYQNKNTRCSHWRSIKYKRKKHKLITFTQNLN